MKNSSLKTDMLFNWEDLHEGKNSPILRGTTNNYLNPIYKEEIKRTIRDLGLDGVGYEIYISFARGRTGRGEIPGDVHSYSKIRFISPFTEKKISHSGS